MYMVGTDTSKMIHGWNGSSIALGTPAGMLYCTLFFIYKKIAFSQLFLQFSYKLKKSVWT